MRILELRRHSFTKKGEARGRGSHLSREGVAAARRLGAELGAFDQVIASTSPRTLETAIAMGLAVDELVEMPSPAETGVVEFHAWREWTDPFATLRQRSDESATFAAYLKAQSERVRAVVDRAGDGSSTLIVGHGGWMESVVAGLVVEPTSSAHDLGGSFWHLDGIRFAITGTEVSVEWVARHPRQAERS